MKKKISWYRILWLVAVLAAGALYYIYKVHPEVSGLVEARRYLVGAQGDGLLRALRVEVGDPVKRGQVLALLDTSDLDAQQVQLEAQLREQERILEADRSRFGWEAERQGLKAAQGHSKGTDRLAQLEAQRAELRAVQAEISRQEQLARDGLGLSGELTDLTIRREALKRYVEALGSGLLRPEPLEAVDQELLITSMAGKRFDRIQELQTQLLAVQEEQRRRTILAPCDGVVAEIFARPGSTLPAFTPVLAVEDPQAAFVDVFLTEGQEVPVAEGTPVLVRSGRVGVPAGQGVVRFVHPGYVALPERLVHPGPVRWAMRLQVALEPGHGLLPGESVRVELTGGGAEQTVARSPQPAPPAGTEPSSAAARPEQPAGDQPAAEEPASPAPPRIRSALSTPQPLILLGNPRQVSAAR